ncbi:MAG: tryptophan--tRNA ligase [Candidatus Pacebacteria bacterium]|nr:tryptophan--tRNA ligase [Candidatus Paceibacterota bacterium]
MKNKKVLVSGVQSNGQLHLGNYFGAIKQMVDLVNTGDYEAYIFLADYHSMTSLQNKEERLKNTLESVATYLACGMDKKKVNIFKQSDVKQVTELAWILNTVTPMSMLLLAHSFKDKVGQTKEGQLNLNNLKEINVGLFDYPVLMAADILIYGANTVPVGKDQEQHIEYARELAGKYNRAYNTDTFTNPESYLKKEMATVLGIDGNKMAKSKGNQISMFASDEEIKKKVMSIQTDSKLPNEKKDPDENNIYKIHKLFLSKEEDRVLRDKFINSDTAPYGYKEAKDELLNTVLNYFKDMKKKYDHYTATSSGKKEILSIIKNGAKNANKKAEETIKKVRKDTGLDF